MREALGKIVNAYKVVKGVRRDTPKWKAWDRHNWGRCAKAAKSLYECFETAERAVAYVIFKGNEWNDAGLSWTLETVARHAWDDGEAFNGQQQLGPVGSSELLGHGGGGETPRKGVEGPRSLKAESASNILGAMPGWNDRGNEPALRPNPVLGRENAANGAGGPAGRIPASGGPDLETDL